MSTVRFATERAGNPSIDRSKLTEGVVVHMFGGGFSLGKILGFKIEVDWSWLLIFGLVVFTLAQGYFPRFYPQFDMVTNWIIGIIAALLLFVSVLTHELMHSIVARRNGIEVSGITLFLFGGVSQATSEPNTPAVEFKMAIAGPAISFGLAIGFWVVGRLGIAANVPVPFIAIAGYLAFINLLLAIFNMVPGFPLDGGRVLRSIIWGVTDNLERATKYSSYAGQAFGYLLMGLGFVSIISGAFIGGLWFIFIGWFLAGAARSSYQQVIMRRALSGVEVGSIMTKETPVVAADVRVSEFVDDYLLRHDYAVYPVVDGDIVRGMVSAQEVRELPRDRWPITPVASIAKPVEDECTVSRHDDAWQALTQLMSQDARRLLVMEDQRLDGVVTRESIFHLVRTKMELGLG